MSSKPSQAPPPPDPEAGTWPGALGSGEHLFADLDTLALGYHGREYIPTPNATHFVLISRVNPIIVPPISRF